MQSSIDIRAYLPKEEVKHEHKSSRASVIRFLPFRQRITEAEKAEFCTQLSVMLQARVPLHRSLEVLGLQAKNPRMNDVIQALLREIQKGSSFSKALTAEPKVFDDLFVVTAEVGQESGRLGEVLAMLSEHLGKMNALKKKFMQAMTYPALVVTVALFAVAFLLVFIVPTFADLFRNFKVELPWSTRLVLRISNVITSYGYLLMIAVLGGVILFRQTIMSKTFREKLESFAFRIPLAGDLILKNHVARFCRTLGTQLLSQVSLVDALHTTQRILSNRELKSEVGSIIESVKKGNAVAGPIERSRFFPPMVAQMITVGEETSELDKMLLQVAEYYEKEIDGKVEQLASVIEPVIVLLLGFLVAGILIAMYLPMFDMVNVVG